VWLLTPPTSSSQGLAFNIRSKASLPVCVDSAQSEIALTTSNVYTYMPTMCNLCLLLTNSRPHEKKMRGKAREPAYEWRSCSLSFSSSFGFFLLYCLTQSMWTPFAKFPHRFYPHTASRNNDVLTKQTNLTCFSWFTCKYWKIFPKDIPQKAKPNSGRG